MQRQPDEQHPSFSNGAFEAEQGDEEVDTWFLGGDIGAVPGHVNVPHRRSLVVIIAFVCWIAINPARADESPQAEARPLIEYPASSDFVVLELTSWGGATVDPQQGPFLRIYGDGRVHVRRPPYARVDPGDFEAYLSHSDLRALLSLCAGKGLMDFDQRAVEQKKDAAVHTRLRTGSVPGVSDAATTTLVIRVAKYSSAGSELVAENFEKSLSWYALSDYSSWYPEVQELARFQEFVDILSSIRTEAIEAGRPCRSTVDSGA